MSYAQVSGTAMLGNDVDRVRASLLDTKVAVPAEVSHGLDVAGLEQSEKVVLADALDDIQMASKLWLLEKLGAFAPLECATLLVLGGWCGVLPWLGHITGQLQAELSVCVDSDFRACSIGRRAIGPATPSTRFLCEDIHHLNYAQIAERGPMVVVNTICEHLHDFGGWRALLPPGVLTVLQSNDYRGCRDHVNCVDSVSELRQTAGLRHTEFEGALRLSLFTRFMLIGRT